MIALFAGSFHPPTVGHIDIVRRAARMFEHVYVAIMVNAEKTYTISTDERKRMLEKCMEDLDNVSVLTGSGLTAEMAKSLGAEVMVRGARDSTDFEYERRIADINRMQYGIETIIYPAKPEFGSISSSVVMDLARHGGKIKGLVPDEIEKEIINAVKKEC